MEENIHLIKKDFCFLQESLNLLAELLSSVSNVELSSKF